MESDAFVFDAYDRLVGRASMAGSPISLIVRDAPPDRLAAVLDRCQSLLQGRRLPDEVLLAVAREPSSRPPARVGRLSVRTAVHPAAAGGRGLEWLLGTARWPIAVFVGAEAQLPAAALGKMLESLEHADITVGRRRGVRGSRHPLAWMVRRLFGVAVADPLSPFTAFRREAAAGIPLELDGPLDSFELLAKSTFAFAIYDELEVDLPASPAEPLHKTFLERRRELWRLFRRPRFWRHSHSGDRVRVTPQETASPRPASMVQRPLIRIRYPHPLAASRGPPFELTSHCRPAALRHR